MRRTAGLALLLLALAGCGDPMLWSRWRAERGLWRARTSEARALHEDVAASEWGSIERRFRAVAEAFPAALWASPVAERGPARDVALASGEASLELAAIALRRGDDPLAAQQFAEVLANYAGLPGLAVRARLGEADALERLGRFDEALAARTIVASADPLGDPDRPDPSAAVLSAPFAVARELRARGLEAGADSVLARAQVRVHAALARAAGSQVVALDEALGMLCVARGDAAGAAAALRGALAAAPPFESPLRLLALGDALLAAGAPDTAIAYVRLAAGQNGSRRIAGQALLTEAASWTKLGRADSALAALDAVFARWNDPGALGPPARFERAKLMEARGQWERARVELRALAAAYPTHPLAFEAVRHIVQHDLDRGEPELARLAGAGAIDDLGRLLQDNHDPQVQHQARAVRADLLLALGRTAEAESSLVDLWRRFPEDSLAEDAALRAAGLAARQPGGLARARALYAELGRRANDAAVRRAAHRWLDSPSTP